MCGARRQPCHALAEAQPCPHESARSLRRHHASRPTSAHQGPFVGVMKGVILTRFPQARIVDLTHRDRGALAGGGRVLAGARLQLFPARHGAHGGGGPGRRNLARHHRGARRPGTCSSPRTTACSRPVVARLREALIVRLSAATLAGLGIQTPSATFHGRDIFAPLAAELAAGRAAVRRSSGSRWTAWCPRGWRSPRWTATQRHRRGHHAWITSAISSPTSTRRCIERFRLPLGARRQPCLSACCAPTGIARPGEYLALVNSFGVVEIARAEQSAAEGLGLAGRGARRSPIARDARRTSRCIAGPAGGAA